MSVIIIGSLMTLMMVSAGGDPLAPGVFIFGDSLADVGNNNYLQLSIAKADFPHNGIDYPTRKPTGRFSNGYNAADLLAEMLGLSSPPPYLYMVRGKMSNFEAGVNFASGGAGIFNSTDNLFRQSIPLTKQIDYYTTVRHQMASQLGASDLDNLNSMAIHAIIIGSNDILGYHTPSNVTNQMNPTQFVDAMLTAIKSQIQRIHDLGGRKFAITGIGSIGCCPQQRAKSPTGECNEAANAMAVEYNKGLRSLLQGFAAELQPFHYAYLDTYSLLLDFIQNPQLYGFNEVEAACCGLGKLKAKVPCIPISKYCTNRSDHLFWDLYHPTEAAHRFVIQTAFHDSLRYTYPFNLTHLISI